MNLPLMLSGILGEFVKGRFHSKKEQVVGENSRLDSGKKDEVEFTENVISIFALYRNMVEEH